jgi:trk system potassium uptake protein
MNPLRVFPVLGLIVMVFGCTLAVPMSVSWVTADGALHAYWPAWLVAEATGVLLWAVARSRLTVRERAQELQARDGMLLVGLVWTLLPLIAALPLLLFFRGAGVSLSFTDAYFEAMSGLTTTGSTVLTGLDHLPGSINLWRCFLQWLGGMGILVLAVAILPMLGMGGGALFKAEATGPMKDSRMTPRITETAKGLWGVYCLVSLACVLAYWLGGMSPLEAWTHMFSTLSLGGLSSHDSSFAYFQSPTLEWIAVFFMLVASGNFALYFAAIYRRHFGVVWRDVEWRGTAILLLVSVLGVALLLWLKGTYADPVLALRMAAFNVVSIASTTGFSTTDYLQWPVFVPIYMLLLSGVATSAGSTGAGIKMARLLILWQQARREMSRIIHPRAVHPVVLGRQVVGHETIFSVLAFMLVYGVTILSLTMLLLLSDLPFDTAFSAVVASINNMGPGLGEVGPAGNFQGLTDFQTWVCTLAMVLGRLEMLSFLVLFTPGFWRR